MATLATWRLRILVLLVAAVLVSGCMRVNRTLLINGDGTGSYVLTIGFREPAGTETTSLSQNTIATMEVFGATVQQAGGSYRHFVDQGYEYWTYIRPFSSVTQADALLQEDPRPYDQTHFSLLYHDSLHIRREAAPFTARLHVTGEISLADAVGTATSWKDATETLSITMPGGITSYQGGTRDGETVTYTIGYNQSAAVDVEGSATATSDTILSALRVPGAILLAIVSLFLFVLGLRALRGPAKP